MRLLVNFIYDAEYGGYVADVPELPGCMSQGKTVEEAMENIKEAISLYMETVAPEPNSSPRFTMTAIVEV